MLTSLFIKNYALINELHIEFSAGLSTITGETGAGKSILLGALGLVLGNRANSTILKDTTSKCIVEAQISIKKYKLQALFNKLDLDFDPLTVIRREILPSGKSRAFVNDTPVTLKILDTLQSKLIDIHSQHQTLSLSNQGFQFELIDALANNESTLAVYREALKDYQSVKKKLEKIQNAQQEANQQHDYHLYLYQELVKANLEVHEQESLEKKLEKIHHIELIKQNLSEAIQISTDETVGIQNLLNLLQTKLKKIALFSEEYRKLSERIFSVKIELDDLVGELETFNDQVDVNPSEVEQLNGRLQLIYSLQQKHRVQSIDELLMIQSDLHEKVHTVQNTEQRRIDLENKIEKIALKLDSMASKISSAREKIIPALSKRLEFMLGHLGMPHARFLIKNTFTKSYFNNGKDDLLFLFSANKGLPLGDLKKVISGGEMSRVMLTIKKVLSENRQLPTVIFDEIDSGVSGEISKKMAEMMHQMSQEMQVITITHLPQIAAKGAQHFKVFKREIDDKTTTSLRLLSKEERVAEIAEMLGGKNLSDTAIVHAKELLS